jgi:hypothetical protein
MKNWSGWKEEESICEWRVTAMRLRISLIPGPLAVLLLPCLAAAGQLVSAPLSHPSGFQEVDCHFVNAGTRDLRVDRFLIEDVNTATSFGSAASGPCTGSPPWTVPPSRGCSRSLIVVAACNQPNACFCKVEFSGSPKNVRGNLIGTVNSSTLTFTAELR